LRQLCNRFDITLLTHAPIAGRFRGLSLTLIEFEAFGLDAPYYYRWRNVVAYADAISRVAADKHTDIVHAVMHNSSLFVAAARVLHPWSMRNCRVIGSLHGSFVGYFKQRGAPPTRRESAAIRTTIKIVDSIVTPSQGVAAELVDVFGARPKRVYPIYNGFDVHAIRRSARELLPEQKDGLWIVTCCRLNDQKDFGTLIDAFSRTNSLPDAKLIIVGDGPERVAIEHLVERFGLTDRVIFAGYQPNPFPWIRSADIFVLSSHYEGFGNVIVEAFALGIPVVASDCRYGPAEIVESGVSGLLFEPGDASCLAAYLDELLTNASRRQQMGFAAVNRSEYFSQERMAEQYAQLFIATCPRRS
jgi:glycosyltransferase involved in cell wall biosynthesis